MYLNILTNLRKVMILSIDSHSNQCLVSLSKEGRLISTYLTTEQNKHDKLLALFTDRILKDNNLTLQNLKAISIVSGPGSFTGLRIGFAFVKGLVAENEINLIKLPTNELFAYQAKDLAQVLGKDRILSLVPSSSNAYFVQEFDCEANPISDIKSIDENELSFGKNYLFVGNFYNHFYNLHQKLNLDKINPLILAEISYKKFNENSFVDLNKFDPDYYFDFIPRTKL